MLTLEDAFRLNPGLNPRLFLPSPEDVLRSLEESPVREWLRFIAEEHTVNQDFILLLFVPCVEKKPYDPPRSPLMKKLLALERRFGGRERGIRGSGIRGRENGSEIRGIYLCAVSEPLSIEPRDFWNFKWRGHNMIYDAPFFPWIEKYGYKWDERIANEVWRGLADVAKRWFDRNKRRFKHVVAYACPDSGYRQILKHVSVDIFVPDSCPDYELKYDENTSRIYTDEKVWRQLERTVADIMSMYEHDG